MTLYFVSAALGGFIGGLIAFHIGFEAGFRSGQRECIGRIERLVFMPKKWERQESDEKLHIPN